MSGLERGFGRSGCCLSLLILLGMQMFLVGEGRAREVSRKVRIAYPGVTLLILPLLAGEKRGFFTEEGLQVTSIQVKSDVALKALVNGDIDYSQAAGTSLRGAALGMPVRVLAVTVNRPPHYLVARPEFKSVKELKGKTLGIATFGGSEHYATREVLRGFGLDPDKDVKWIPSGQTPVRLQVLKQGLLDATALSPPANILANQWGLSTLAWSGDYMESPFNGVVATIRKLKEQRDEVKRVLRVVLRGLKLIREDEQEGVRITMEHFKLDREMALASYKSMRPSYSPNGEISDKGIRYALESLREQGQIKAEVPLSQVVDFTLLREVQQELGLR